MQQRDAKREKDDGKFISRQNIFKENNYIGQKDPSNIIKSYEQPYQRYNRNKNLCDGNTESKYKYSKNHFKP